VTRGAVIITFERSYLAHLLERSSNNVSKAARISQLDRSHLSELIRMQGLRCSRARPGRRPDDEET
jgi:DNA-binding NtrC family response regulator